MTRPTILLVNGNGTESITEKLHRRLVARFPEIGIRSRTPRNSPAYVSTPVDLALAAPAVMASIEDDIAEAGSEPDACIIGCFGEPGLSAARHRWRFPVIGMAEASVLSAMQLAGRRVAIVTAGRYWPDMLRELLRAYGLEQACAGIVEVQGEPLALAENTAYALSAVETAVDEAIRRFDPTSIILGGASLVGLASHVQARIPTIDCLDAAMGQALALAAMTQASN